MTHGNQAASPPPDRESIERFVRVTLGCKCPDEVFQSIAIDRVGAHGARGVGVEFVRLTIGDRLLIYLRAADDGGPASEVVAALARTGIAERDARGLNRFRLAIVRSGPPRAADDVHSPFAAVAGTDERAHLHVVDRSEVPPALQWN